MSVFRIHPSFYIPGIHGPVDPSPVLSGFVTKVTRTVPSEPRTAKNVLVTGPNVTKEMKRQSPDSQQKDKGFQSAAVAAHIIESEDFYLNAGMHRNEDGRPVMVFGDGTVQGFRDFANDGYFGPKWPPISVESGQ